MMEKDKGAPIDILVMKEGGGWDMDTAAILKGTKNLEAAKALMDFAASRKANELYATRMGAADGDRRCCPAAEELSRGRRGLDDQE